MKTRIAQKNHDVPDSRENQDKKYLLKRPGTERKGINHVTTLTKRQGCRTSKENQEDRFPKKNNQHTTDEKKEKGRENNVKKESRCNAA